MQQTLGTLFGYGSCFLAGGSLSAVIGTRILWRFWQASERLSDLPLKKQVGIMARDMILPHILTFLGMGLAVFGLILIVRGILLRYRLKQIETEA